MALLLTVLCLGALRRVVPSDAEIAAQITEQLRALLHPATVQVMVRRASPFSTTFERVEITLSKFSVDTPVSPSVAIATPPADPGQPLPTPAGAGASIRIISARIECREVTAQGLEIPQSVWEARELRIPLDSLHGSTPRITAAESVTGYLLAPQESLTGYLKTMQPPIDNPHVTITSEGCRITGTTRTFIKLPIQLTGRMLARDGAVLYFDDPNLKVSLFRLPASTTRHLLRTLNPLIDLNTSLHLPAPLTITGVTHQAGALRLDMALSFPVPEGYHVSAHPN